MNEVLSKLVKDFDEMQGWYYAKHSAFCTATEMVEKELDDWKFEQKILFEDVIEPSDTERSALPEATRNYILKLEELLPEKEL